MLFLESVSLKKRKAMTRINKLLHKDDRFMKVLLRTFISLCIYLYCI